MGPAEEVPCSKLAVETSITVPTGLEFKSRTTVADVLNMVKLSTVGETGKVKVEAATLTEDLGAESIDFLDIVFRLEKSFSIKIPRGDLFPDDIVNNPDHVENGLFTAAGLQQLKASMPHADFADFEKSPSVENVPSLFTVKTMVNYVELKLAKQPA